MSTNTPKRGGKRPGAGAPRKDPSHKVVKCYISMTQAHHAATNGDRAGIIRRALDVYPGEVDTCVVGVANGANIHINEAGNIFSADIFFTGGVSVSVHSIVDIPAFAPGDKLKVSVVNGKTSITKL